MDFQAYASSNWPFKSLPVRMLEFAGGVLKSCPIPCFVHCFGLNYLAPLFWLTHEDEKNPQVLANDDALPLGLAAVPNQVI